MVLCAICFIFLRTYCGCVWSEHIYLIGLDDLKRFFLNVLNLDPYPNLKGRKLLVFKNIMFPVIHENIYIYFLVWFCCC